MTSASRLIQLTSEHERSELGRDLHDDIIQGLTAVKMDLTACAQRLAPDTFVTIEPFLGNILKTLDQLVTRARHISDSLAAPVLEDLGLTSAIEWEAERCEHKTGLTCTIGRLDDVTGLKPQSAIILYRAFQRTLDYMALSPGATGLHIEMTRARARVVLLLVATGETPRQDVPQNAGLSELTQQLQSWGGRVRAWRTPDGVRMLQVSMPYETAA
jgi:signal transduction histidine kinase